MCIDGNFSFLFSVFITSNRTSLCTLLKPWMPTFSLPKKITYTKSRLYFNKSNKNQFICSTYLSQINIQQVQVLYSIKVQRRACISSRKKDNHNSSWSLKAITALIQGGQWYWYCRRNQGMGTLKVLLKKKNQLLASLKIRSPSFIL